MLTNIRENAIMEMLSNHQSSQKHFSIFCQMSDPTESERKFMDSHRWTSQAPTFFKHLKSTQ